MSRVYNFSAGPSMMPESVLKRAAAEMLDYQGSGQIRYGNVHADLKPSSSIADGCSNLLREVMQIPDNYEILFLQGGGSTQFAMIPLNLATGSGKVDMC